MQTSFRVFYHYSSLEEFHAGMWKIVRGERRKDFIQSAANLMREPTRFEIAMRRAFSEWPNSCRHNLTSLSSNRIAWLGHAGCCIGTGSPEEATRAGWHTLNFAEQDGANKAAAIVLGEWDVSVVNELPLFKWAAAQC